MKELAELSAAAADLCQVDMIMDNEAVKGSRTSIRCECLGSVTDRNFFFFFFFFDIGYQSAGTF